MSFYERAYETAKRIVAPVAAVAGLVAAVVGCARPAFNQSVQGNGHIENYCTPETSYVHVEHSGSINGCSEPKGAKVIVIYEGWKDASEH